MICVEGKTELYISPALVGKRYPRIATVHVTTHRAARCAVVKVKRCADRTGGPFVRRLYYIYSRRTLVRWLRVAAKLYTEETNERQLVRLR